MNGNVIYTIGVIALIIGTFFTYWGSHIKSTESTKDLKSAISSKNSEIDSLKKQSDELIDGKNVVIQQNAELNEKINDYQKELREKDIKITELEQKTMPRSLLIEQQKRLLSYLKDFVGKDGNNPIRKITVTAANGNQEAQKYATEFIKIFKTIGCESDLILPIPGLRPDIAGIHIGVMNSQDIPEGARILSNAFSAAGIKFTISRIEGNFLSGVPFALIIGSKL